MKKAFLLFLALLLNCTIDIHINNNSNGHHQRNTGIGNRSTITDTTHKHK